MQANSTTIYNTVSTDCNLDLDFVTAVGDFMQKEIADNLRHPDSLIVKVKGLGGWHLRKVRLQNSFDNLSKVPMESLRNDESRESFVLYLQRMKERLADYDNYIKDKSQMKQLKDEYYSQKPSQNNI